MALACCCVESESVFAFFVSILDSLSSISPCLYVEDTCSTIFSFNELIHIKALKYFIN
jgi:hypothetical protein